MPSLAPAKINLCLHVTGKRDDGYHLLSGLSVFADIGDVIDVSPADALSLEVGGMFADDAPTDDSNLALQAARALQQAAAISNGATISLMKNMPIAAGIGGGSSDAAATLTALAPLWDTHASLTDIARALGADVPMCLYGRACLISGVGDDITPIEAFPALSAVLINPGVAVSTAAIFQENTLTQSGEVTPPLHGFRTADDVVEWLTHTQNDLTDAACANAPVIHEVLTAFSQTDNAQLARMSGSGATCFALYPTLGLAEAAARTLESDHPDWWVRACTLR